MGKIILVLGESGSGKSTSLRNFEEGEVGIFSVTGKPMPFRKALTVAGKAHSGYPSIGASLAANKKRCYVVDDANYLMSFENFAYASQQGYQKFTTMACNFEALLEAAADTDDDTTVYFMMHPEFDVNGFMRPKTIGKMLNEKLCVEGMFAICLVAQRGEDGYVFVTKSDGMTPAKVPFDMDVPERIPNDLKAFDTMLREYYGMGPTVDSNDKEKEASNGK